MHRCPVCNQACHCNYDVDDIDVGDADSEESCCHCPDDEDDRECLDEDMYGG